MFREKVSNLVMPEMDFEKSLEKCVDKSLAFLGDSGKKALFWHLKTEYGVTPEQICKDPSRLTDCLEKFFGPGEKTLEARLIESICKDGKKCKEVGIERSSIATFNDAVNCLKKGLERKAVMKAERERPSN